MQVVLTPEALDDLDTIHLYISERASVRIATDFVAAIDAECRSLADAPYRGTGRDDIRPGVRTFGFRGRATIAFHVDPDIVVIDRILYGGRDLTSALGED